MPHAAGVAEVAGEPFVVVGEVVDAIGHYAIAHHVGVVHAGAGFLLPSGVVVAFEAREDVAGHVPHMGDAGRGLSALADGRDCALGVFVVPQVNSIMMAGMLGVFGEDFGDLFFHGLGVFFGTRIVVHSQREKCLCFEIVREFGGECLSGFQ